MKITKRFLPVLLALTIAAVSSLSQPLFFRSITNQPLEDILPPPPDEND